MPTSRGRWVQRSTTARSLKPKGDRPPRRPAGRASGSCRSQAPRSEASRTSCAPETAPRRSNCQTKAKKKTKSGHRPSGRLRRESWAALIGRPPGGMPNATARSSPRASPSALFSRESRRARSTGILSGTVWSRSVRGAPPGWRGAGSRPCRRRAIARAQRARATPSISARKRTGSPQRPCGRAAPDTGAGRAGARASGTHGARSATAASGTIRTGHLAGKGRVVTHRSYPRQRSAPELCKALSLREAH